jgi:hypothetical protein
MLVTLADLKRHMNITSDADDAVLTDKIYAAEAWAFAYTGKPYNTSALDPPPDSDLEPLKEAVRQLAAHFYENREATLIGVTAQELPFGLMALLEVYREWSF